MFISMNKNFNLKKVFVLLCVSFLYACSSSKQPQVTYNIPEPSAKPIPASESERINVRLELAKKYISLKQFELANASLDEVLSKQENAETTHLKALTLMGMQNYVEADKFFKKSLAKDPNPDLLNNYGWFLCKQKNIQGLHHLNQAEPKANAILYPKILANKGACYLYTKDYINAKTYLNKSLELSPNYIAAVIYNAFLLAKQNNYLQAEADLNSIGVDNIKEPELLWIGINVFKISGNAISTKLWGNFLIAEFPNSIEAMRYHRNDVED